MTSRDTIHLVDDHDAFRASTQWLLESHDMHVVAYRDGPSFLAAYTPPGESGGRECVLLDMRMPHMSGLQLQEQMRARGMSVPVIFMTAHGDIPLAVAAMQAGERVCLVDMDGQATLSTWSKTRGANDAPVIVATPGRLNAALAALADKGFTLAIVDTPGAEGPAANAAMMAAQLCVIPSRPTAFDLWASANTRKTLRELKAEYVFLLNQCPPLRQISRIQEGARALQESGALLSPMISARVDFQDAARAGGLDWDVVGPALRRDGRLHIETY